MRSMLVRRSAVAASAVSLALLVTACGGSKDDNADAAPKDKAGAASASAAPAAAEPAAKVLSEAELKKALVTDADLEGFKIKAGDTAQVAALAKSKVSTDKAECEPLARLLTSVPMGEPAARALAMANQSPKKEDLAAGKLGGSMTLVGLASYEGKGAEEALASLRAAGAACAGGFTVTQDGAAVKVTKLEELKVSGGDEATGWKVTAEVDGTPSLYQAAAVRQGATLATFPVQDLGFVVTGKAGDYPAALSDAQIGKLAQQG
ncbi:hypothetical protein [Streptomyces sp. CC228A]|uniref:hypothetical protein n=1 Tax=Streptomyces sp. CC228A TaxID=2898186 RepID=UPI001F47CD41|nr:hypothetical protein [Streptomyces sp. CC228A]